MKQENNISKKFENFVEVLDLMLKDKDKFEDVFEFEREVVSGVRFYTIVKEEEMLTIIAQKDLIIFDIECVCRGEVERVRKVHKVEVNCFDTFRKFMGFWDEDDFNDNNF